MIIYKVTNTTNGKAYIGQTWRKLNVRKSEHHRASANILKSNPTLFHLALREFGTANFVWEVLEICTSINHCNEREKFYIKLLGTLEPGGYNSTTGGQMDETMTEKVRNKIAESMILVHKDPKYQKTVYPKLKGLVPPNKGVAMSKEQKAKVSAARRAVHKDPTYINPNVGQKRTDEQKANIRKGQEGRMAQGDKWQEAHKDQFTDEVREKMRQKKLGKKPKNTKQILCIETGQIFEGLTDAAKALDVNRQSIYLQIKGKLKLVAGRYTFKYVEVL